MGFVCCLFLFVFGMGWLSCEEKLKTLECFWKINIKIINGHWHVNRARKTNREGCPRLPKDGQVRE